MTGVISAISSCRSVISASGILHCIKCTMNRKINTVSIENNKYYDMIIVGGGMVGSALACAAANNRRLESTNILLLEGSSDNKYTLPHNYSNRVVALNQQTRILLSSIGAWQHIEASRYCPVHKMQVLDACSDAAITFNEDLLQEELAYIVENDLLIHSIKTELMQKPSVDITYNAKVKKIIFPLNEERNTEVILKDGKKYETGLLVGADGGNSRVREAMGVQYIKWDYDQMGIVATLKLSEPTDNVIAWQRFLPTGPIALLPLTDSLSSLVWSVTTNEAKKLLKITEEEFVDNINEALWKMYPKDGIVQTGMWALEQMLEKLSCHQKDVREMPPSVTQIVEKSRAAFPLGFGHAVNYVKPGVVLIGDAAHRVHPLAGQGVNLGFGDVTILIQILAEAVSNGAVLGDINYLKRYETLRQRHNVPTMLAIDALHRLYKGTAAPIVLARSLGLQLTNALPVVKKAIIQHAADHSSSR